MACGHAFCDKCIFEWSRISLRCPVCRASISPVARVGENPADIEEDTSANWLYEFLDARTILMLCAIMFEVALLVVTFREPAPRRFRGLPVCLTEINHTA